jgi:hypothetical protein
MIYVKVKNNLYPASIAGKMSNREWDGRESKAVTIGTDFATANALFPDGVVWSIVNEETVPVVDEEGNPVLDDEGNPTYTTQQTEFDNSEFNIRGDLTVHIDGRCTVEMGKETSEEALLMLLYS